MGEQHRRIESLVEELRRRTAELEEANLELQRVGRYRSLFLQRMSHELRTPLTSILGFAEILIDHEPLTATQRRFCEKIQSSGFQLQASLDHLVDLSRLEAGQTELFLHEFSIRETLRESCAAVARLAQKQGVTLDCAPAPSLGGIVSDEGKLRQVLYNFFAFAIGRSPAGGVDKDAAAGGRAADGEGEEVVEDLAELALVRDDGAEVGRRLAVEPHVLLLREPRDGHARLLQRLAQGELVQEEFGVAGFEAREVNELVETCLKLEAGGLNLLAEAPLRVREALLVEEDFGEAEDRGQGRAQLVRHAREEERAVAAHALEFEVGLFEFRRAPAQLLDERLDSPVLLDHRGAAARVAERDDDRLPDAAHPAERAPDAPALARRRRQNANQLAT